MVLKPRIIIITLASDSFTTLISPSLTRHHPPPHHPPLQWNHGGTTGFAALTLPNPCHDFKVPDFKDGSDRSTFPTGDDAGRRCGLRRERRFNRRRLQTRLPFHELLRTSALITFHSNEENKRGSRFIIRLCLTVCAGGRGQPHHIQTALAN